MFFFLNGNVNKQNCRYWSDENPHLFTEGHTQNPQKLNVWAGILGDRIIGPFFIEENLTGEAYREMLNNLIEPSIVYEVENQRDLEGNLNLDEDLLHFQQDGAPPHYAVVAREWLDRFTQDNSLAEGVQLNGRQGLLTSLQWISFYGVTLNL